MDGGCDLTATGRVPPVAAALAELPCSTRTILPEEPAGLERMEAVGRLLTPLVVAVLLLLAPAWGAGDLVAVMVTDEALLVVVAGVAAAWLTAGETG